MRKKTLVFVRRERSTVEEIVKKKTLLCVIKKYS